MTRRKMLDCCECGTPAIPATGRMEHDWRRAAWDDGTTATCPKCGALLRVYVMPDFACDQVAQVVLDSDPRRNK